MGVVQREGEIRSTARKIIKHMRTPHFSDHMLTEGEVNSSEENQTHDYTIPIKLYFDIMRMAIMIIIHNSGMDM